MKMLLFSNTAGCFLIIKALYSLQLLTNIKCRKFPTAVVKTVVGIYNNYSILMFAPQSSFEIHN